MRTAEGEIDGTIENGFAVASKPIDHESLLFEKAIIKLLKAVYLAIKTSRVDGLEAALDPFIKLNRYR